MGLGQNIHDRREELGITLDEVGRACGTSKHTICKYEKGVIRNIPSDKIEKIAKVLKTTPQELMGWEEQPMDILVQMINNNSEPIDALIEVVNDFSKEELALLIEYAEFIKGRRK